MPFQPAYPPFGHQSFSVAQTMRQVLYALIPGIVLYVYFFGWGIVVHLTLASLTALAAEAVMLRLRERPMQPFLGDGSAVLTAWLLALSIPPLAPWWVSVTGAAFAIVFAKHLYGGLGYNSFNPAMVGYAMLLISFPLEMTHWPAVAELSGHYLGLGDSLALIFGHQLPAGVAALDAISSATPLDAMKTQLHQAITVQEIKAAPLFGDFGAKGWEWMGNAFFLGGLWLIFRRVISWHIPVAMLGTLFLVSALFFLIDPDTHPSPLFHIFSGAAILGAFFIATDPVTAATSIKGRLIYGALIGLLVYIIRTWGGYPDGVAFAVLLMNMSAPLLDYYTKPRVFGHGLDEEDQRP